MQVLSLLVHDDWGVMQRITAVFTRKRISIDSVLAGPCEKDGCARVLLASADPKFPRMVEHLRRVQDVIEVEYIENNAEEFVLLKSLQGRRPISGKPDAVDPAVDGEDGATYVRAYGAM